MCLTSCSFSSLLAPGDALDAPELTRSVADITAGFSSRTYTTGVFRSGIDRVVPVVPGERRVHAGIRTQEVSGRPVSREI